MPSAPPQADLTVVLVHGIGNQRPGDQLARWGEPCVNALNELPGVSATRASDFPDHCLPATRGEPFLARDYTVQAPSNRAIRLRMVEANWSRCFRRPWLRTILWLIKLLPASILLFTFDARDRAGLDELEKQNPWRRAVSDAAADLKPLNWLKPSEWDRVQWRFIMRIGTLSALILCFAGLFAVLPLLGRVLLLAIPLALLINPWTNLASHVIVAMENQHAYREIFTRVEDCFTQAAGNSKAVTVLGHSQGGFIAHDVLSTGRPLDAVSLSFIGLGSGLKPITVLRDVRKVRVLIPLWLALVGIVLLATSVWRVLDTKPGMPILQLLRGYIFAFAEALYGSVTSLQELNPRVTEMLDPRNSFSLDFDAVSVVLLLIGVLLWVMGILLPSSRAAKKAFRDGAVVRSPWPGDETSDGWPDSRWAEMASYHDSVGRMLFPELPTGVLQIPVSLGGNPLADHVSYFRRYSIVPRLVAERILCAATRESSSDSTGMSLAQLMLTLSQRRRRLRNSALIGGVMSLVLSGMLNELTLKQSMTIVAPVGASALLVSAILLHLVECHIQRRFLTSQFIRGSLNQRAAVIRQQMENPPKWVVIVLLMCGFAWWLILISTALFYKGTTIPLVCILQMVVFGVWACVYWAGYRPPRWAAVSIVGVQTILAGATFVAALPPGVASIVALAVPGAFPGLLACVAAMVAIMVLQPGRPATVA